MGASHMEYFGFIIMVKFISEENHFCSVSHQQTVANVFIKYIYSEVAVIFENHSGDRNAIHTWMSIQQYDHVHLGPINKNRLIEDYTLKSLTTCITQSVATNLQISYFKQLNYCAKSTTFEFTYLKFNNFNFIIS